MTIASLAEMVIAWQNTISSQQKKGKYEENTFDNHHSTVHMPRTCPDIHHRAKGHIWKYDYHSQRPIRKDDRHCYNRTERYLWQYHYNGKRSIRLANRMSMSVWILPD